jgi:putative ABC transport system permease protein
MLKIFFLSAYRNLIRNSNYAFINSIGLSIGLASCIIIFLIVQFELHFDTFHSKYNQIYRVVYASEKASGISYSAVTPYPFGEAFRNDFPYIPVHTQLHFQSESQLSYGTEKIKVENFIFADSLFFEVFDFGIVSGNPHVDLGQPGKVFLTEALVEKIGPVKNIKLDNKLELEVAGIVKNPPANSHLTYNLIVSWPSLTKNFLGFPLDEWGMHISGFNYIILPKEIESHHLEKRLVSFTNKYHENKDKKKKYSLQPLADIHFNEQYQSNASEKPSLTYNSLLILILLGAFILVIACINFINLNTALAIKKSKEIGVRKTLGANASQLTRQYLLEAFFITLISTIIAIVIIELSLGHISTFLGKELQLNFINNPTLTLFLFALVLFTSLLSGLYPALVLSRFQPAAVLKNKLSYGGSSGAYIRKYLVIFQFLVAQVLIIGTLVVGNQMDYFRSKPLGFIQEAIVNVALPENSKEHRNAFKAQLESVAGIEKISFSVGAPTSENNFTSGFYLTERGTEDRYEAAIKPVDINYLETYGIHLVAGRWFNPGEESQTDLTLSPDKKMYHYVVNEALVKKLGFDSNEEILGKKITTGLNDIDAPVIGVVKDFHTTSLHQKVLPTVMMHFPYFYYDAGIRFHTATTHKTLEAIEMAYNKVFPNYLFEYNFLDQHLESLYQQEEKSYTLVKFFAALSILISCLGLLGLISFVTQQKVKEIGIRKVFGASVKDIVYLFSADFVKLIIMAFVVAAPLAWYAMHKWLEEFAYKTTIDLTVFGIAIVVTLFIALLTVSIQAIRAALANPVVSLRSE